MDSILEPILNKNSTKKLILDNLIELQPQTLKEIHFKIKKLKNISYQATHKAIQEMQQENLIQKDNKKYSINQFWIDSLSKKLDQIKQNQEKENFKKKYFFDTYSTFAKFIIDQAATIETNNLPSICVMEHSWPPLGLDQNDLLKITLFLKKGQYYDLTINNTPLDIAFAKTLEKMGKTVKIGSKFKLKND
ncbi:MAG: hypothetical protein PHX27_04570, partial [Candidatus ainarchaeum sp.]|nr:hypothetical protein [Candidatus ainarchaeum sp.]